MLRKLFPILICTLALMALVIGCSDDDTTPTSPSGGSGGLNFTEFGDLVQEIAPPIYDAPVTAPGDPDSMWTEGDYALLGKVFGEDEPMSLYSNIEALDQAIAMLEEAFGVYDSLNIADDSSYVPEAGVTVTTDSLTSITPIPVEAQSVFGFAAIDLDRVFKMQVISGSDTMQYHVGYKLTAINESYLSWFSGTNSSAGAHETNLYHASLDLTDSSLQIHGVFFKIDSQETATWAYEIQTIDESDFAYRMAWFSDMWGDTTGVGSVIGGGNSDTLFAMKYRQWSPANEVEYDTMYALDQMFDSAYTYLGSTIATGLNEFVVEDSMFTYSDQPTDYLPSPWAD